MIVERARRRRDRHAGFTRNIADGHHRASPPIPAINRRRWTSARRTCRDGSDVTGYIAAPQVAIFVTLCRAIEVRKRDRAAVGVEQVDMAGSGAEPIVSPSATRDRLDVVPDQRRRAVAGRSRWTLTLPPRRSMKSRARVRPVAVGGRAPMFGPDAQRDLRAGPGPSPRRQYDQLAVVQPSGGPAAFADDFACRGNSSAATR